MTDLFISYSTKDAPLAQDLCKYLELNNLSCWIAPRNIAPGMEYAAEIINGIEGCKVFLLIFSEHSNQSQHVLREVGRAVHRNVPIIAYRLSGVKPSKSMEYFLESVQWLNAPMQNPNQSEVLISAIHNLLGREVPVVVSSPSAQSSRPLSFLKKNLYPVLLFSTMFIIIIGLLLTLLQRNNSDVNVGNIEGQPTSNADSINTPLPADQFSLNSPEPSSSSAINTDPSEDNPSVSPSPESSPQIPDSESAVSAPPAAIPPAQTAEAPSAATNNTPAANSASTLTDVLAIGTHLQFGTYHPSGYADSNNDGQINWIVLDVDKSTGKALCIASRSEERRVGKEC